MPLRLPALFTLSAIAFFAAFGASNATASPSLVSGEAVKVATEDRRGPFSLGLSNTPVAAIRLDPSRTDPDLLISIGRHNDNPGLYLLPFSSRFSGHLVFGQPIQITFPGKSPYPPPGAVWQDEHGVVHGFWLMNGKVTRTRLDQESMTFVETAAPLALADLPRRASRLTARPLPHGAVELVLAVSDGTPSRPPENTNWRSPDYHPYDGALIYRGGLPYDALYAIHLAAPDAPAGSPARQISGSREALYGFTGLTWMELDASTGPELVGGTHFGNIRLYRNPAPDDAEPSPAVLAADPEGVAIRHRSIGATPVAWPDSTGRLTTLIVGGEGGLYHYRYTGRRTAQDAPVFDDPVPVLAENADLYPGSLPVLSAGDWNGDGRIDLIAGNSEGRALLFANLGTNRAPAFAPGVEIQADGEPIHLQQGYVGVQGPQEQRWGYSAPRVFDWNGDGLLDLVMSGAPATHDVYLNHGTPAAPRLGKPRRLYADGLDLHGTWRVQPGLARVGDRVAYVMLDDQDEFHLHWRLDDRNLLDGGKLLLEDGRPIRANFLHAGGTGRAKIQLVDWDLDGRLDLLVGTPRHGSIPDPEKGLPKALGLKGAAVVFLKNIGTNDAPRFAAPSLMKFRGQPIYHGQHACSPVATELGDAGGPNLFVGSQDGRIHYYARADLSWD